MSLQGLATFLSLVSTTYKKVARPCSDMAYAAVSHEEPILLVSRSATSAEGRRLSWSEHIAG